MSVALTTAFRRVASWVDQIESAIDEADTIWDDLRDDDPESLVARQPGT